MRADTKTYQEVAEKCSEFAPCHCENCDTTFKSMYSDGPSVSCTNCKHFDENKYCKLNLFDKIVENNKN